MKYWKIIITLSLTLACRAYADEFVGITEPSLSLTHYVDVASCLSKQGYTTITNTLFSGVILTQSTDSERYAVLDLSILTDRKNTNVVITIVDARTSRILQSEYTSAELADAQWLESVLARAKQLKTSDSPAAIHCGFGGSSHLSPQNRRLAILLRQQAAKDKSVIALDREFLANVIQLQEELAHGNRGLAAGIVGQLMPNDLAIFFADATGGGLNVRAMDSVTGKPFFKVIITDGNGVDLVVNKIKEKKPQPPGGAYALPVTSGRETNNACR